MMINEEEALVLKTLDAEKTRSVLLKFSADGESDPMQVGSFVKLAKSSDGSFYMNLSKPLVDKPAYDLYYIDKENAESMKCCVAPSSKGRVDMELLGGEQGKKSTKLLFEHRKEVVHFLMSGVGEVKGVLQFAMPLPFVAYFMKLLGESQEEEDDF